MEQGTALRLTFGSAIIAWLTFLVFRHFRRRTLILQYKCEEVKSYPHRSIFGLDVIRAIEEQMAESRRLESIKQMYDIYGSTYSVRLFGKRTIYTIDPENLRSIFATNFQHYGLQPFRLPASMPAIGRNIFTTDGAYWKHSRDQVTPIFTRTHLSDISGFEQHFDEMLAQIPRDSFPFDMMPLIENMVNLLCFN